MRLAAIQHDIIAGDVDGTLRHVAPLVDRAVAQGADLVVLSEMFATGFVPEAARIAQPMDGPAVSFLREHAARHHAWFAGTVAIAEPGVERARNRFIAAGPSGELYFYDKRHPFSYAGEHLEFAPGDAVVSFIIDDLRITPMVCYDLRFADDFWEAGPTTDLFVIPANWPARRRRHWSTLLAARAIENQCYVAGINRVGSFDGLDYSGDSVVVAPNGEKLVEAAWDESILFSEVSADVVRETRAAFPVLDDRR